MFINYFYETNLKLLPLEYVTRKPSWPRKFYSYHYKQQNYLLRAFKMSFFSSRIDFFLFNRKCVEFISVKWNAVL